MGWGGGEDEVYMEWRWDGMEEGWGGGGMGWRRDGVEVG